MNVTEKLSVSFVLRSGYVEVSFFGGCSVSSVPPILSFFLSFRFAADSWI